ncbi:transcriptional regulator, LysR family [Roseovarius marisflavi]|uniref:Transcriptional regulator, LysR family n=1 Tax=Roseovarius marisflavi TaxID=1054996 RepID=A0A1M6V5E9_9RHOB|nr:LysR family transcriptional regulator [Roseovarius marisflavi]SHK76678.1 transcriptional regulator, LysR family [Roseovarius marisflavi]
MKFDLRHIRYFMAVAEELHFRRAAERLGIAQPALSRAVRDLEDQLEVRLFDRTNRSVQITPAGTTFLEGCRGVINAVENTVENTRRVHDGQIGRLRIGYTDMAIAGLLPRRLKDFQAQQPGLVLQPHHDVTTAQLHKLDAGELDVGFVTGPISRLGYDQCLIQSERFVCVLYEHHPLANRKSIRLEELAHEDFVHGTSKDWEHFHAYLIPLCRRSGFVPRVVQEAFNSAGILGLVACGMGVTILTDSVRGSVGAGLIVVPLQDVSEQLQTVAIWKSETPDRATGLFIDFLREVGPP